MIYIWSNLNKRLEYKLTLMHFHMRNRKIFCIHDNVIKKKYIDIQSPWSPVNYTLSSCFCFNIMNYIKKLLRFKICFYLANSIHKIRLINRTIRFCFNICRNLYNCNCIILGKLINCSIKIPFSISQIRTKSKKNSMS